jgi:DNA-binding response OmpR family regulator
LQQRKNLIINDDQLLNLHNINVLLIHNDHDVYQQFDMYSQHLGNTFFYADSVEYLRDKKLILAWDVIYIDVGMYHDECIDIINIFKLSFPDVKIIFLGDSIKLQERIDYLQLGADLILSNHLAQEEFGLITRYMYTNAKMNHQPMPMLDENVMFDIVTSELHRTGTDTYIELNQQEASIIKLFILNTEQKLETWQLLDVIGSLDNPRGRKNLEVFISRLRKKMAPLSNNSSPIKAVRNYGYHLTLAIRIKNYT